MANSGEKFLYFLIGGFVGASVALLFAPKSGEETRSLLEGKYREGTDELSRRVQSGREYVTGAKEEVAQKLTQSLEKGKETISRRKEQIGTAIEAGKKAYQEEKSKLEDESSNEES